MTGSVSNTPRVAERCDVHSHSLTKAKGGLLETNFVIFNHGQHVNHLCIEIHLPDNPYWTWVLRLLRRIEEEAGLRHFSTEHPDAPHESAGVLRPLRAALLRDGMVQALSDTCRVSYPGAICNELRKVSGGCFHPD
ncbi:uncharacterized protein TNCV_256981 [Trichonephila clavipes]|nr:uncharacterized protein TNCV_256981 [Trichonephila clavipes]